MFNNLLTFKEVVFGNIIEDWFLSSDKDIYRMIIYIIVIAVTVFAVVFIVTARKKEKKEKELGIVHERVAPYKNLKFTGLKNAIDNNTDMIIIDIRDEKSYKKRRIPKSINVPYKTLKKEFNELLPDKNKIICIYCQNGMTSITASRFLGSRGYGNIFNCEGINDWHYPTESDTREAVDYKIEDENIDSEVDYNINIEDIITNRLFESEEDNCELNTCAFKK